SWRSRALRVSGSTATDIRLQSSFFHVRDMTYGPEMSGVEHNVGSGKRSATSPASAHLITIVLSAAGLGPLREVLQDLPGDLPAAIMVAQHIGDESELPAILQDSTPMRVKFADPDELLQPGTVYVCPPRFHAVIRPTRTIALSSA